MVVTGRDAGPTLVLAHGFGRDQNRWRLVVPPLAERYRLVLFDHTGSGRSDALCTLRAAAVYAADPAGALTSLNTVLHREYRGADPRYYAVVAAVTELLVGFGDDTALLALSVPLPGGDPP